MPLSFEATMLDEGVDLLTAVVGPPSASINRPVPYAEASFLVTREVDPHEAPIDRLADYVEQIIAVEGPIHLDEVTARIRILWGLGRAGSRIRAAVKTAVQRTVQRRTVVGGPFYSLPGQQVVVRDRSNVGSLTLRRPEMLPPAEIEQAMLEIVQANFGAGRDDLIQAASRAFGFASTSGQLRGHLAQSMEQLVSAGHLVEKDGLLVRGTS